MLEHQKPMFDMSGRCYCINSFCCLKTLENMLRKFILLYFNYNDERKKHEGVVGFKKMPVTEQRHGTLTSLNLANYVPF